MKCPKCGHEFHSTPRPAYSGFLTPVLDLILERLKKGDRPYDIASDLVHQGLIELPPWRNPSNVTAMISVIRRRYGVEYTSNKSMVRTRNVEIFKKSLSGTKTKALAEEYNLTPVRIHQIVKWGWRRLRAHGNV